MLTKRGFCFGCREGERAKNRDDNRIDRPAYRANNGSRILSRELVSTERNTTHRQTDLV